VKRNAYLIKINFKISSNDAQQFNSSEHENKEIRRRNSKKKIKRKQQYFFIRTTFDEIISYQL